ncbi:hypothetical protein [Nostoc sp. C110]
MVVTDDVEILWVQGVRQHDPLPPCPLKPSTNICGNGILALGPTLARVDK